MTTTDIARMESNAVAILNGSNEALHRLGQWVTAAEQAHALVAPLVHTAFIPDAYKPKVDPRATPEQKAAAVDVAVANATAAVLQGITLGMDPLMALQQIYIVHGRPGLYAEMMVALLQSHGHEVWTEDISDTRAVLCGRRKGTDYIERVTVTMEQARKAGWTTNQAYSKTPQDMLWARAASRVCKRIASDVLKGIASVEEIQDAIKVDAVAGATRIVKPPRMRTPAAALTAAAEDPPLEADTTAEAATPQAEPAESAPVKRATHKQMHDLLAAHNLTEKDEVLAYVAGVAGRDVQATKELTETEAHQVIAALKALEEEAQVAEAEQAAADGDDWPPVEGALL